MIYYDNISTGFESVVFFALIAYYKIEKPKREVPSAKNAVKALPFYI